MSTTATVTTAKTTTKKSSVSETDHSKNVKNFETLMISCKGFGSVYNPSNEGLTIANLVLKHLESKKSVKQVKLAETPFNDIEGQRSIVFKPLKATATKVLNALRSSKVPSTVIDDAETINRKIQGKRADNTVEEAVEGKEAKAKNSVSQQSFDMQLDHFEKLVALVDLEANYKPNETELKVATLNAYATQLDAINTSVKDAYTPYKNALDFRNDMLYAPQTGLIETAKAVKNYVKSVFGNASPQYKQISKLVFKLVE